MNNYNLVSVGYDGGKGTSTSNQELLLNSTGYSSYLLYEFSFLNTQECTVIVNGSNPIPCPAEIGFQINKDDAPIKSFKIVESGIDYTWRGKIGG